MAATFPLWVQDLHLTRCLKYEGYNIASALEELSKVDWEWVVTENLEIIIMRQGQPAGHTEIG